MAPGACLSGFLTTRLMLGLLVGTSAVVVAVGGIAVAVHPEPVDDILPAVTNCAETLPPPIFSDEELIDSILKDHPTMTREEVIEHLQDADILSLYNKQ